MQQTNFDVIVVGGGAAGLMAAATAGKRGRKVLLLEVSNKLGKKILMSGGGRCNFTNLEVEPQHFISENPHFVKSALSQYTNWDFISMVAKYGIDYHEKEHGQLFCDRSAKDILKMLVSECELGKVTTLLNVEISEVKVEPNIAVKTNIGEFQSENIIIATGGLSIPTLGGATGFGYKFAEQLGLKVHPISASLVPMTLTGQWQQISTALSGVSLPVVASVPSKCFSESMLFTHRGLSGPAILQLSNYWQLGEAIQIDLLPLCELEMELTQIKQNNPNRKLISVLISVMPKSIATTLAEYWWPTIFNKPLQNLSQKQISEIAQQFHQWQLTPSGTEGYRTAEVTRGGVDVNAISSKTMQVKNQSNVFFIGEVLDVTGHLGGFNFQWAWSSGFVAGSNA